MKVGIVARIRVNPRDCQSLLDVLDRAGVQRQNMSFSGCVSMALASLLETARLQKIIPEPDPFNYLNRLSQYVGNGNAQQNTRSAVASGMGRLGDSISAPTLAGGAQAVRPAEPPGVTEPDNLAELEYAKSRLSVLVTEKDMAENGVGNWPLDKEQEFQLLYKIVYPHG